MVALPSLVRMVSPKSSSFEGFSRVSSSKNKAHINVKTLPDFIAKVKRALIVQMNIGPTGSFPKNSLGVRRAYICLQKWI